MFNIRGADGREYGPVDATQLRAWINEGRAGGPTLVKAADGSDWVPLSSVPEFADIFKVPPPLHHGATGAVPPIVSTIAWGLFVLAGVSVLWCLAGLASMWRLFHSENFHPGVTFYLGWTLGLISLPLHVVCGVGLLRKREWARRLAVIVAILFAVYGVWGIVQTGLIFFRMPDSSFVFRSPSFLLSQVWGLAVLAFNIASAVILSRRDVRAAFAQNPAAAA